MQAESSRQETAGHLARPLRSVAPAGGLW